MMLIETRPYFKTEFIKSVLIFTLFSWSAYTTYLLVQDRNVILIGIDENGARTITDQSDRLIAHEKISFVKRFLLYSFNFDSQDFNERITNAGNLMNQELWNTKLEEFKRTREELRRDKEFRQSSFIEELREIDDLTFEADLAVNVQKKLSLSKRSIRVEVKINPHKRTIDNPSAWEVTEYVEIKS